MGGSGDTFSGQGGRLGGIQGLKLGETVACGWERADGVRRRSRGRRGDVGERPGWAGGRFGWYDWDPAKQAVMFSLTTGASEQGRQGHSVSIIKLTRVHHWGEVPSLRKDKTQ